MENSPVNQNEVKNMNYTIENKNCLYLESPKESYIIKSQRFFSIIPKNNYE